ncbi:MAG TPA: SDR family oxidoreductase [Terriglobales bacterium]|nr:SDR family oxidoreductase [Terriglobales bacterium]
MAADLAGRNILITGANSGIGKATAAALAERGAQLWLACRSRDKTEAVIAELRARSGNRAIHFLPLELDDLDSVRTGAAQFLAQSQPLHVLINNAGVAGHRGVTRQGFELTFGTNHLGHFLLTELLRPRLLQSAPARIVIVASRAHKDAPGIDFDALRRPTTSLTGMSEYSVSKLCNVLHARELARQSEGSAVTTYGLHPGVIASDIWRRIPWPVDRLIKRFMKSNQEGAAASLMCAADPALASHSGRYYDQTAERQPASIARDPALAEQLWQRSAEWTKQWRQAL